MKLIHGLAFDNLRGDIYGGLTAAVVALPLALAFGVASGAGPVAGLYGAIFVGFFAAIFGGTPAQVSGPTGPLTIVMAGVFTQFGNEPAMAFTVVMLAGVFQILFGVFKLGRYISLVPFPVISGFMSGIGCIIIILQLAPLVGHATPGGGPLVAPVGLPALLMAPGRDAAILGLFTLGLVYLTPARMWPKPCNGSAFSSSYPILTTMSRAWMRSTKRRRWSVLSRHPAPILTARAAIL